MALSAFDALDGPTDFLDFVDCGDCGRKCYNLEGKMDKKTFAVTFMAETMVFHNLECLNR